MSVPAPTADLFRSERMRRRRIVNWIVEGLATAAALLAVGLLIIVVSSVVRSGWRAINVDFFTHSQTLYSGFGPRPASGIANAIVGTLIIIGIALLMALPVAVLTAIYLNELAPKKLAGVLTLAFDVLNGIPAIVLGIFVFVFVVVGHGQAAWKASFALAILMVPMIARSTQEVLALVPASMREASLALGAAKWRTVLSVVLPQAVGGIVTGATLATARAAGETAPLLFTSALFSADQMGYDPRQPLASIPMFIFTSAEQADPVTHQQAWGAAAVLIGMILIASLIARWFADRSISRLKGER